MRFSPLRARSSLTSIIFLKASTNSFCKFPSAPYNSNSFPCKTLISASRNFLYNRNSPCNNENCSLVIPRRLCRKRSWHDLGFFSLEPKSSILKPKSKEEQDLGLFFSSLTNHNQKRSWREEVGLTWRDTLEGYFCQKLVFLKVMKVEGYFYKLFLYLSLLNEFP